MKVVAIVQARIGSRRLQGKVLADIGGRSMLARVVRRARRAKLVDELVVATSDQPSDRALLLECRDLGVAVFRGSEDDVLDRYQRAARAFGAEAVARVTSDCPLVDPEILDRVISDFQAAEPDYASNTLERTFPRGLDVELISAVALERAAREAREPYERVHVTPYIYRHPERFRTLAVTGDHDLAHHRWTVDTSEDLELVRAIYARLDNDDRFAWRQALEVVEAEPQLMKLNRKVRQKRLEDG